MYTYYVPVEREDHMLYTNEIASILGFKTVSGSTHTRLVSSILKENRAAHKDSHPHFYNTANGLKQCFSVDYVIANLLVSLDTTSFICNRGEQKNGRTEYTCMCKNTTYTFYMRSNKDNVDPLRDIIEKLGGVFGR